jgi:hypothetical protein
MAYPKHGDPECQPRRTLADHSDLEASKSLHKGPHRNPMEATARQVTSVHVKGVIEERALGCTPKSLAPTFFGIVFRLFLA